MTKSWLAETGAPPIFNPGMPKTPKGEKGPLSRPGRGDAPLSTGAVARACGVTRDGVLHWIHAGKLRAFRTPGGHFRVRPEDLTAFLRESGRRHQPLTAAGSGPARILVVDDEGEIRDMLRELLEDAGYEVVVAGAADAALDAIARRVPDLVITDLAMPGENGADLTRRLRHDPHLASLPVIAVTGALDEDRLEEIYAAGADLLICKPFLPAHVLGEVRRLLEATRQTPDGAGGAP